MTAPRLDRDLMQRLRAERGLSFEALANLAGATAMSVYYWENRQVLPRAASLVRLAHALQVSPAHLLGAVDRPLTLAEARLAAGMSTREAAEASRIGLSVYNRIERGLARPTPDQLERIGLALGRTKSELCLDFGTGQSS